MAQPHNSRDQQTWQEHPMVTELLAELQTIEERRQCAMRFHQLMGQRGYREIPIQYERLFLHTPAGKEKNAHDHHRGTPKSHRKRVPRQRV